MNTLAAHITCYDIGRRMQFREKTVLHLLSISGCSVFVHTDSRSRGVPFSPRVFFQFHDLGSSHQFDLAKMSRAAMLDSAAQFQHGMYIEDDIAFDTDNFEYYRRHSDAGLLAGSCVSFLRYELDMQTGEPFFTDITRTSDNFIQHGSGLFSVTDNQYCGLWIQCSSDLFRFAHDYPDVFWLRGGTRYGTGRHIRESAAIGPIYTMYSQCRYFDEPGLFVHHMPNNYVGSGSPFGSVSVRSSPLHTLPPGNATSECRGNRVT